MKAVWKTRVKMMAQLGKVLWGQHRWLAAGVVALSIILALIPGAIIATQKRVVDLVSLLRSPAAPAFAVVLGLISLQYLIPVAAALMDGLQQLMRTRLTNALELHLQHQVASHSLQLPLEYLESSRTYDQIVQAEMGTKELPQVMDALTGLFQSIVTVSSIGLLLLSAHWALPVALVGGSLPGSLVIIWLRRRQHKSNLALMSKRREADHTYRLLFSREAAKEIRIFQLGPYLLNRWSELATQLLNVRLRQTLEHTGVAAAGQAMMALVSIGVAGLLAWRIAGQSLSVGEFVALATSVVMAQQALRLAESSISQFIELQWKIDGYVSFLSLSAKRAHTLRRPFPPLRQHIRVQNISYRYPGSDRWVLRNLSLEIRPGETLALVGENGAGKSTLVHCLLGLLEPTVGQIYYDGVEQRSIDEISLHENVTAVFQNFVRFPFNLRENIGLGHIPAMEDLSAIESAASEAGVADLHQALPEGWATPLGVFMPKGVDLSGGQWQRIAIARALMRPAQVFVLDEPSAALDPIAERDLFDRFARLAAGRTCILISHRIGSARQADRIGVLKEGKIVELGTHEELLGLRGEYARLYETQAHWYRQTDTQQAVNQTAAGLQK